MQQSEDEKMLLVRVTANIVAAYVGQNGLPAGDLPLLIGDVHRACHAMVDGEAEEAAPEPAVSVQKSVQRTHLVCLEDGKKFKSLKRHLRAEHDLSPEEYRQRWGLPGDYPMVAPDYAAARSRLAKEMGLGGNVASNGRSRKRA